MKLAPFMTLHVVSKPVEIGTGPQGTRTVFDVTRWDFPRLPPPRDGLAQRPGLALSGQRRRRAARPSMARCTL